MQVPVVTVTTVIHDCSSVRCELLLLRVQVPKLVRRSEKCELVRIPIQLGLVFTVSSICERTLEKKNKIL